MEISKKKKMCIHIPNNVYCLLCNKGPDLENLGYLHFLGVFSVHRLCLFTANELPRDKMKSVGLFGCHLNDIYNAYLRYTTITCEYCNQTGAAMVCSRCKRSAHLPCAVKNGAQITMARDFLYYCVSCRSFPSDNMDAVMIYPCPICFEPTVDKKQTFWPTCCKSNYTFHLSCLKQYAISVGRIITCPICYRLKRFRYAIEEYGVYVPNIDTAIENYFTKPLRCSAKVCIVKAGIQMSGYLIPCIICHKKICHSECSFSCIFLCKDCIISMWPTVALDRVLEIDEVIDLDTTFPWIQLCIENLMIGSDHITEILLKLLKQTPFKYENCADMLDEETSDIIRNDIIGYYKNNIKDSQVSVVPEEPAIEEIEEGPV